MGKGRLEAFSDGVIAVIITIMVLEMKVPHGTDVAALRAAHPRVPDLRAELRLRRHLLEQPSPHAARGPARQRRRPVGQPAPAVLAVAHPVRDGLDERESLRGAAGGDLRRRAVHVRRRVLHFRAHPRAQPRRGFAAVARAGSGNQGNRIGGDLRGRDSAGLLAADGRLRAVRRWSRSCGCAPIRGSSAWPRNDVHFATASRADGVSRRRPAGRQLPGSRSRRRSRGASRTTATTRS